MKLIIEIDGDIHFYDKNIFRDKKREAYLKNLGLKIKRYTNLDISYNIENVLADLRQYLDPWIHLTLALSSERRGKKNKKSAS